MDMGRELLIEALPDIRIMRDSMTSQGLIKSLNHKTQVVQDGKIKEELRSDVAIFADEVANLFSYERTRASQMVIFLTRAYGCPAIYDHTTVRDSIVRLHNLYPVLLGGTDPHNLKVLPEDAIGGLTGRLIWIVESQRRKNNSGWIMDDRRHAERAALREMLIHDLQTIAALAGPMRVDWQAMKLYDLWYEALSKKDPGKPEIDAFYQRCHTTALRLATLLSISRSNERIITEQHMAGGIALVEQQLPEIERVALWSGNSVYEQHRAKLINFLQHSGGVSLRRLALRHMGMPSDEFDKLVATLIQDHTVTIPSMKIKGDVALKLMADANGQPGD